MPVQIERHAPGLKIEVYGGLRWHRRLAVDMAAKEKKSKQKKQVLLILDNSDLLCGLGVLKGMLCPTYQHSSVCLSAAHASGRISGDIFEEMLPCAKLALHDNASERLWSMIGGQPEACSAVSVAGLRKIHVCPAIQV